jgi:hypothetical protein
MKKLLMLSLALVAFSCGEKKTENTETTEAKEWKQMDDFHMIMAEAFHPYKDSANLLPAKQMAEDMAISAAQWVDAELPEKVRNDEMKATLQQLNTGSQDLLKLVIDDAADSLIAKSLTDLHDTFHKIQEGWYGSEKKEGEGHEHH